MTAGVLLLGSLGCERGCARDLFSQTGLGPQKPTEPGAALAHAVDCPDGLARCNGGVVEASRLTTIPQPCVGPTEKCVCPWDRVRECDEGCVVDGADLVAERGQAMKQLCGPPPAASAVAAWIRSAAPSACDEEQLYRCAGGAVVDCAGRAVVATCVRGCFAEGASVGGEAPVTREAAVAMLCTR